MPAKTPPKHEESADAKPCYTTSWRSFTASFPISSRPISTDGRVKTDVLGALCGDLIEAGVHGLTPLGSDRRVRLSRTTRSARRRRETIEAAGARAGGRRRRRHHHGRCGAPGASAIARSAPTASSPFSKPISRSRTRRSKAYFRAIADAVDMPVVLYTNPQFQRSDLSLDVIARLAAASAHRLHQGRLDQYRPAAVDHEPLRDIWRSSPPPPISRPR
jgi:4-hydroxy-tetrahydrodipicolinate synthase